MRWLHVPILCMFAASGAAQQGLSLTNGVDAHIDVPYATTVVPQSGVTFEAWVTYDESTLGPGYRWPTLVRQNTAPGQETFLMRVDAGQTKNNILRWYVRTTRGTADVQWAFPAGMLLPWTHVAGTYDGTTARLFVKGNEVASAPGAGPMFDRGGVLRIGNGDLSNPGAETWNGEIDEARLWPVARSAGEIQSTMNLQLSGLPGEVSSWNLNGNGIDSSGGNHGTPQFQPQFAGNTLALIGAASGGANYGAGTAGCGGTPRAGIAAEPTVGNWAFAVSCLRCATSTATSTSAGIAMFGLPQQSNPLVFMGISIWLNLAAPSVSIPVAANSLATCKATLPIPAVPAFAGAVLGLQYFWVDPNCATLLYSSDGLIITIQP